MSQLRKFLRNKIRYQRDRIRSGLRIRHDRAWGYDINEIVDDFLVGVTLIPSPRMRLHHGIRKGIRNLRKLRALESELNRLLIALEAA